MVWINRYLTNNIYWSLPIHNCLFVCIMFFWLIFIVKVFIIKVTMKDNSFAWNLQRDDTMDTSSSIRHGLNVEIPREKFVEISSVLKGKSTWKLWHWFTVEISTWIRLSKSTKYRWVLHVDCSMSLRRRIDVTSVLAVSILSFPNLFTSRNLF